MKREPSMFRRPLGVKKNGVFDRADSGFGLLAKQEQLKREPSRVRRPWGVKKNGVFDRAASGFGFLAKQERLKREPSTVQQPWALSRTAFSAGLIRTKAAGVLPVTRSLRLQGGEWRMTKQEIIVAIRKAAEELGHSPSQAEMRRRGVAWHQIWDRFGGMRRALMAAGLQPGNRGNPEAPETLILDWGRVVREMKQLPSRAQYGRLGNYSPATLHARLDWGQMAQRFVLMVSEYGMEEEWADVVEVVMRKYPLLQNLTSRAIATNAKTAQSKLGNSVVSAEDAAAAENRVPDRQGARCEGTEETIPQRKAARWSERAVMAPRVPKWLRDMGAKRVLPASVALHLLMAMEKSTQQSAASTRDSTQQSALSTQSPQQAQERCLPGTPIQPDDSKALATSIAGETATRSEGVMDVVNRVEPVDVMDGVDAGHCGGATGSGAARR